MMRLDMLIRLIMRILCRGACQQCVRYYGTALLPPHLHRRCLLLYCTISEPLFHVCCPGGGSRKSSRMLQTGCRTRVFIPPRAFRFLSFYTFLSLINLFSVIRSETLISFFFKCPHIYILGNRLHGGSLEVSKKLTSPSSRYTYFLKDFRAVINYESFIRRDYVVYIAESSKEKEKYI